MTELSVTYNDDEAREVAGAEGTAKVTRGWAAGARLALVAIEKHHKLKEMIRSASGGMRLTTGPENAALLQPAVADKITSRTGILRKSYTRVLDPGGRMASYGSDYKLAEWLEDGTRAHEIWPKMRATGIDQWGGAVFRPALRFASGATFTRRGNYKATTWQFATHVNHPGTKPRPTVKRTFDAIGPTLPGIFGGAIDAEFAKQSARSTEWTDYAAWSD